MARPPDNLRDYVEHHRGGYRRFHPPHTVASFEAVLQGWHYHRHFVAAPDGDDDAELFFHRFTDFVQMKTGVYSLRYWGFIIDGLAGGTSSPFAEPKPEDRHIEVLERAHALFFDLYDAFWAARDAGTALRGTPPPDDRYS